VDSQEKEKMKEVVEEIGRLEGWKVGKRKKTSVNETLTTINILHPKKNSTKTVSRCGRTSGFYLHGTSCMHACLQLCSLEGGSWIVAFKLPATVFSSIRGRRLTGSLPFFDIHPAISLLELDV